MLSVTLKYLVDLNATKAAVRAGYMEKSASSDRLRKPEVAAAIQQACERLAEKVGIETGPNPNGRFWHLIRKKSTERCKL